MFVYQSKTEEAKFQPTLYDSSQKGDIIAQESYKLPKAQYHNKRSLISVKIKLNKAQFGKKL